MWKNNNWRDVTALGPRWEVQYQPGTGRHRHRPHPQHDPTPVGTKRPPAEWREGPPPE